MKFEKKDGDQNDWKLETWNLKLETPFVSRRSRPKYPTPGARRKRRGGGLRWLLALALVAGAVWLWREHEQPEKIVHVSAPAPAPAAARPQVQPLTVSRQSPTDFPRPVHDVLEAQIALARRGISPGSIDAALGSQTRAAISVFQGIENLPPTGKLDADTRAKLTLDAPLLANYIVTTNDLARLQPLGKTWLAKSRQNALDFETERELVAEKSHSHPLLIQKLNLNVNWTNLAAGTVLKIPDVNYPEPTNKAAFVVIHLSGKFLEAFDEQTNLMARFPCSIAAKVEKRPLGELRVDAIAFPANYTFDPELFPESGETQKLILPPGPNNPVGIAWITLDKPGYGIHGTPAPEQIGRTESHGCFRLANWDAEYLLKLAWVGMPVLVEP
jgi:lipoprotein-anchoring transpeptidase ErfK/SrfK